MKQTLKEYLKDDLPLVEMANLPSKYTGVEGGIIYISTALGSHGPRVKFYKQAGKGQPSFSVSVEDEPKVIVNSLPDPIVAKFSPKVIEWVKKNKTALESFWNEGTSWDVDKVQEFVKALQKI